MQIQISWLLQNTGLIKNNLTELYFSRRSCVICRTKLPALTLSTLGKIFSRQHIEIFFLFFPRKMDLLFHANCLFSADDILKYFPYFSQKTGLDISIGYNSLEMSNPVFWKKNIISFSSACIKGSLGVRDSQKLPWDFQKSVPEVWDSQLLNIFSHL